MVAPAKKKGTPTASPADAAAGERDACPLCRDTRWIKKFTPWGCPASQPCPRCNGSADTGGEIGR